MSGPIAFAVAAPASGCGKTTVVMGLFDGAADGTGSNPDVIQSFKHRLAE